MGDSCNRDQYIGGRSSTRTHHASASHHSKTNWSFGWSEPEKPAKTDTTTSVSQGQPQKVVVGSEVNSSQNSGQGQAAKNDDLELGLNSKQVQNVEVKLDQNKATAAPKTSSNMFANGSNQNSGNVITDRPTTRVHAPPGGRSQIIFG